MSQFSEIYAVAVNVTDLERTKKFYSDTLQWPLFMEDQNNGWIEWGEHGKTHFAAGLWREAGAPPTGGTAPIFTVEDPQAVLTRLRGMGVKCDDLVTIPGMVVFGTFYDPDGNAIQFAKSLF